MEEDEDPGVNHDALIQDMPVAKKEKRGFPSRRKVRCNYCWKVIGIINFKEDLSCYCYCLPS